MAHRSGVSKGRKGCTTAANVFVIQYKEDPFINEIVEFLESSLHEIDEMIIHDERSLPPFSHLGFRNLERRIEDLVQKRVIQVMKDDAKQS